MKLNRRRSRDSSDSMSQTESDRGSEVGMEKGSERGIEEGGKGGGKTRGVSDSGSRAPHTIELHGLTDVKAELEEQLLNLMSRKREYEDIKNLLLGNHTTHGEDRGDGGESGPPCTSESHSKEDDSHHRIACAEGETGSGVASDTAHSLRAGDDDANRQKDHKRGREGRINPFSDNKNMHKHIAGEKSPKNDSISPKIGMNSPVNGYNSPKGDFSTSPGKTPHPSPQKLHLDLSRVVSPDTNITPNITHNVNPTVTHSINPSVTSAALPVPESVSQHPLPHGDHRDSAFEGINPMYANISPRALSPRNSFSSSSPRKSKVESPLSSPEFLGRRKSISESLVMRSPGKKQKTANDKDNMENKDGSKRFDVSGISGDNNGSNSDINNSTSFNEEKEKVEFAEMKREKSRIINDLNELNKLKINMLRDVHLMQAKLKSGITENGENREKRQSASPKSLLPPNLNNTKNIHLNNAKMIKMAENAKRDKQQINELLNALKITKNAVDSSYSNLQKTQEKMFEFFNKSEALKDENEKLKQKLREFLSGNNNNEMHDFMAAYSNSY